MAGGNDEQPGPGDTVYCSACGEQNPRTANFCQRCGSDLPTAGHTREPAASSPGREGARRAGARQPGAGQRGQTAPRETTGDDTEGTTRRTWLKRGVVGTVLLGGGLLAVGALVGPEHRLASDDAIVSEERNTSARSEEIVGTLELPEGTYLYTELTPQSGYSVEYELVVESSDPIDVLTVPADQFSRYQDENRDFSVVSELTERDVSSTTLTATIEGGGEYRVIFDNTGFLGASPSGTATVDYEVRGSV